MGKWQFQACLACVLAALFVPVAPAVDEPQLAGVELKAGESRKLSSYRNSELTTKLNQAMRQVPEWKRLINGRRMAVAIVDLNGNTPRFASVNGDVMMYAASLPKIAILLAAYQAFEDGTLEETPEMHEDLGAMIRRSSNKAATRMIDRLGMKKIQEILSDSRYGLYDINRGGGLWVGKRYASDGPRRGDPMFNLSHGATADQVARFYYMLVTGRLVSPTRSAQMLQDLSEPALNHKFVAALRIRAPSARLYRKSGTWKNWHSDSVLVRDRNWRNYILVALVQSSNGEKIINAIVPVVENIIEPPLTTMF